MKVNLTELLTGLAEECCELGKAALKLHRVFTGVNPTPVTEEVAIDKFEEEVADVELYLEQIEYSRQHVDEIKAKKKARWEARLRYAGIEDRESAGAGN